MSLRPGLLPSLARAARPALQKRSFHFLPNSNASARTGSNAFKRAAFQDTHAVARAARPAQQRNSSTLMYSIGLGLAGFALTTKAARCDAMAGAPVAPPANVPRAMEGEHVREQIEAKSIVSLPTLTFGAVCGICAGVFVKKGFKLVAFFLGGVFVLLQYLQSKSYVSVDWKKVSNTYDNAFVSTDAKGDLVYPTPQGLLNGFVDFLTANFQQRATFIAGFLLGLRVG